MVTGDLRITGKYKLRKLFTKGSKYMKTHDIQLEKATSTIVEGINDCIYT